MNKNTLKRKGISTTIEPFKRCAKNDKSFNFQDLCKENTRQQIDVLKFEHKKTYEENSIKVLKVSKVFLDEDIAYQKSEWIEDKVTALNCITYLSFSQIFKLQEIFKTSLRLIERWFTTIADSEDFLELDFKLVAAILSSSELLIDSELEVLNAANIWLNHKIIERSKHAKYLLQRVRLSLLTVPALQNILENNLWIFKNDECTDIINKAIRNKKSLYSSAVKPKNRYCSQENFKFLFVSGQNFKNDVVRNAFTIEASDIDNINNLSPIKHGRKISQISCIKGEIYVIGGVDKNFNKVMPVEKYSPNTNTWNVIAQMYDDRRCFCACSFIDSIYVLGGLVGKGYTSYCLVFNTESKTWVEIARMNEDRYLASCAVFEGNIVVTGGCNDNYGKLNSVEAYDHIDNSWKNMPNMIEERCDHKSVVVKNKLYVVSQGFLSSGEVFDSFCNKFVLLKYYPECLEYSCISKVTSIGNKMVIFCYRRGFLLTFDVENEVWYEKIFEPTQHLDYFSYAKLPKFEVYD